jgi:tubulin gamma
MIQSYSVFPHDDVVLQPYNSVLTLKRLIQKCDSVIVLDNSSLTKIASEKLHIKNADITDVNSIISMIMCSSTQSLRFPGIK